MLQNYLTIIRRIIYRQPVYFLLNVSCLSLGIAAALLVLLYLDFELNYDRSHANADRIYRIDTQTIQTHEKEITVDWASTPANLGPYLQQDYPEIEKWVRVFKFWQNDVVNFEYQHKNYEETEVYVVDSSVFQVFSFDLIKGNPENALQGPDKIVLSASLARRIFSDKNPVGKILTSHLSHNLPDTKNDYTFEVTGVFRDMPKNTQMVVQAMISPETDVHLGDYYFSNFNVFTYVLLHSNTDSKKFSAKLSQIYKKYLNANREPVLVSANHELTPITKIHLKETGGLTYVYIFSGVGLLLLLIAGVSYVNLTTAQAGRRALEIGIRKVMGSNRRQLIGQFLAESIFFTLLALVLGMGLVFITLNSLNKTLGLQLAAEQFWQPTLLLGMPLIVLLVGVLGGSYPAFFLSSFEPVAVMKGKGVKGAPFRSVLVAVQFAVAIFVLISTAIIYHQLQYLQQKDLGFDQQQMVLLTLPTDELQKKEVLKTTLLESPFIVSTGASSFIPGADDMVKGPVSADGSTDQEPKFVRRGFIDDGFLPTMNIPLVAGRNFSPDFPGDAAQHVIVNETLVHTFGLKDPIGEKIRLGDKGNPNFLVIIGVVKDFHQSSLHQSIEPQLFQCKPATHMAIKVEKDVQVSMHTIENSWAKVFPDKPFTYDFLDDALQKSYEADQSRGQVFFLLSLLTIFIAFLGLFGLASYLTRQRIKEIGIRKVLGAGSGNIVLLMTRNFLLLVILAALPAFLGAWYMMKQWLENFAFRTNMNYLMYGWVLAGILLLTFVTTGLHAFYAAQRNPADILKFD